MRRFALCVLALSLVLLSTGCEDDELPLTATQLRIQALLDQLHVADQEVDDYKEANGEMFPSGYNESGTDPIVRTYTNYTNANGVLIDGTDSLTAPPPPQDGSMDMDFSGGSVGTLVRLRLNITIPAVGPRTCTLCKLDETDVTEEAQALFNR
ncbi:MAG: hypothetical protein PHO72_06315 [Sphaerochaeta sp.]|nr:hypothetical protein [Sphaerochaeta sp.]